MAYLPHDTRVIEALDRADAARVRLADAIAASDQAAERDTKRAKETIRRLVTDGTSSCCGAEEEFDPNASTGLAWRYRCRQCGLLQQP